jgi:hypothetical protein
MNIFIITYFDMGGGTHRLATAINENTEHQAIAARWDKETWTTGGLYGPSEEKVRELFAWADVVQIQNTVIGHIPADLLSTKPITFYYRGSDFRDHHKAMKERARAMGATESANFLDIVALCGVDHWIPCVIEDFSHLKVPHTGFKVAQCPSQPSRYKAKNTREVIAVMSHVPGFELITNVSWRRGLQRKGQCDVIIDQFVWGYGNSGVEAMSMGIPVLANAQPEIITQMEQRIGYLPFICSTIDELPERCIELRDNPALRQEWGEIGRQYWHDFHSPKAAANRAIEVFQETIDGRYVA